MRIMVPNKQKTCQSAICSLKFLSRVSSLVKNSHCAHTRRPKRAIERFRETKKSLLFSSTACALYKRFSLICTICMHAKCLPAFFILKSPSDSLSDTHVQTLVQIWTKRSRHFARIFSAMHTNADLSFSQCLLATVWRLTRRMPCASAQRTE
jgi:hypothetical protein